MLRTKRIIAVLLACILTVVAPISIHADDLSVTPVKQAMSNWCWAACAQMVGLYEESGSTRTQWDVVMHIYGGFYNYGGNVSQTAQGAEFVCYDVADFLYGGTLSESQVAYVIDNLGNPLIIGVAYPGVGHMVVVAGYDGSDVKVIDPADASTEWMTYAELESLHGGIYVATVYTTD